MWARPPTLYFYHPHYPQVYITARISSAWLGVPQIVRGNRHLFVVLSLCEITSQLPTSRSTKQHHSCSLTFYFLPALARGNIAKVLQSKVLLKASRKKEKVGYLSSIFEKLAPSVFFEPRDHFIKIFKKKKSISGNQLCSKVPEQCQVPTKHKYKIKKNRISKHNFKCEEYKLTCWNLNNV